MSDTSPKASITIKKYANRRLYNTATSSYVTLEDLSLMVKEGTEFNVYDAKTSEDITRTVLTQIIVEEEGKSGQQNLLPISFLRQLIGFYGDSLQWMVPKYLEHSMQALTGNQDQIRSYFQNTFGNLFPFGTTLEEMSKQNMAMFERTMRLFSPFGAESTMESATAPAFTSAPTPTTTKVETPVASATVSTTTASSCAAPSCCSTKTETSKTTETKTETQPSASVTNLKPRTETVKVVETKKEETKPAATVQTNTPMPNVQASTSSASGADDMQQKIANLQRQLADLAKSRAH